MARSASLPSASARVHHSGALASLERVEQVRVAYRLVPEHGAPERPYLGGDERVDRDLDMLYGGRVGRYVQLARCCGDLPGQLDIAVGEALDPMGEPYGHALGPQVDIGMVVRGGGQLADRLHQGDARPERPGPEVRARQPSAPDHPPVLDAIGLKELPSTDPIGHALNVADEPSARGVDDVAWTMTDVSPICCPLWIVVRSCRVPVPSAP
jgi:hypothetical protein